LRAENRTASIKNIVLLGQSFAIRHPWKWPDCRPSPNT
jgi:hypothetical protein